MDTNSENEKVHSTTEESKSDSDEAVFVEPHLQPRSRSRRSSSSSESPPEGDDDPGLISIFAPKLDYTPPPWAIEPEAESGYGVDVIKGGVVIDTLLFNKRQSGSFVVIGRLPSCDIHLEHPSISRHHCILQYGEDLMGRTGKGWHIYDLGSTHGTKLNKNKIPPKQYIRVRVGHVMQFGGSTRIISLVGPPGDMETEWEYSPTEMRQKEEVMKISEKIQKEKIMEKESDNAEPDEGISWGLDYGEEMAYAQAVEIDNAEEREAAYRDDPMKALSRFFDKEGFDMDFVFSESGHGHTHKWTCSIDLPVDTAAGQSLSSTATCSGSKKDAQKMCALNACRILDMHGVLYRSVNEARKKERNLEENDFYDSDEDTFLDRTGQIEESRQNRRRRAMEAKGRPAAEKETYEGLLTKIASANKQMEEIEEHLASLSKKTEWKETNAGEDELDVFYRHLSDASSTKDDITTKTEKSILRQRLVQLKHEKERMEILAKIAKPVALPELKPSTSISSTEDSKRPHGTMSATTMQKLMTLRRAKMSAKREDEQKEQTKAEKLTTFASAKVTDTPFVAEVEDEDDLQPKTFAESFLPDDIESSEKNIVAQAGKSSSSYSSEGLEKKPNHEKAGPSSLSSELHFSESSEVVKRKRIRIRTERPPSKFQQDSDYGDGVTNKEEEYATWLPPENQTGDGTTSLNAKFSGRY